MRILAFDPGYARLGWGAISASERSSQLKLLEYGVIETPAKQEITLRMHELHIGLRKLIQKIKPDCIGMERLYFSKNQKSAAGVYQAQGLILAAAGESKSSVWELEPRRIKYALSGSGKASKEQLMQIICRILGQTKAIWPDDAADALACAIAAYFQFRSAKLAPSLNMLYSPPPPPP